MRGMTTRRKLAELPTVSYPMNKGNLLWAMILTFLQISCGRSDSPNPSAAAAPRSATSPPATVAPATTSTAAKAQALEEKLMGTWVAKDVDAKIGQVKIKLTFRKDGPMKLAAWSDIPFVGQVRDKTAPYEVHGDVISSDAIRGGTSVTYWFEGEQLLIRYKEGKTVRFDRE